MKELWLGSHGRMDMRHETAPHIIWVWWIAFLFPVVTGFTSENFAVLSEIVTLVVSSVALIILMRDITRAQATMSPASVFE